MPKPNQTHSFSECQAWEQTKRKQYLKNANDSWGISVAGVIPKALYPRVDGGDANAPVVADPQDWSSGILEKLHKVAVLTPKDPDKARDMIIEEVNRRHSGEKLPGPKWNDKDKHPAVLPSDLERVVTRLKGSMENEDVKRIEELWGSNIAKKLDEKHLPSPSATQDLRTWPDSIVKGLAKLAKRTEGNVEKAVRLLVGAMTRTGRKRGSRMVKKDVKEAIMMLNREDSTTEEEAEEGEGEEDVVGASAQSVAPDAVMVTSTTPKASKKDEVSREENIPDAAQSSLQFFANEADEHSNIKKKVRSKDPALNGKDQSAHSEDTPVETYHAADTESEKAVQTGNELSGPNEKIDEQLAQGAVTDGPETVKLRMDDNEEDTQDDLHERGQDGSKGDKAGVGMEAHATRSGDSIATGHPSSPRYSSSSPPARPSSPVARLASSRARQSSVQSHRSDDSGLLVTFGPPTTEARHSNSVSPRDANVMTLHPDVLSQELQNDGGKDVEMKPERETSVQTEDPFRDTPPLQDDGVADTEMQQDDEQHPVTQSMNETRNLGGGFSSPILVENGILAKSPDVLEEEEADSNEVHGKDFNNIHQESSASDGTHPPDAEADQSPSVHGVGRSPSAEIMGPVVQAPCAPDAPSAIDRPSIRRSIESADLEAVQPPPKRRRTRSVDSRHYLDQRQDEELVDLRRRAYNLRRSIVETQLQVARMEGELERSITREGRRRAFIN
ncbi:hypothetical protein NA57DRAFT_76594 [Rhizodiscina lignyota]|uniref:Uncharacterized protein n=1 Tax=Rhizodiscina lignyota TaxID=1504668 RepID=A0A9P4IGJ5_9PEZI|nr:hypothetical protein NA57DRAFT_76594 [Rhizodiscina lignyota]